MFSPNQLLYNTKTHTLTRSQDKDVTHLIWSNLAYKEIPEITHDKLHTSPNSGIIHSTSKNLPIIKIYSYIQKGYILPATLHPKEDRQRDAECVKQKLINEIPHYAKALYGRIILLLKIYITKRI